MKKLLLLYIFTLLVFPCHSSVHASNYYFTRIDGEKGLSQNNVKSIIQDSYGFMWFGSKNKLNRYDGTSIKVYDCFDKILNKRNNNISALFEDTNRLLWVGTDKGIYIFDPILETFSFFNESAENGLKIEDWVADIQIDNNSNIWIVIPNQGLFRYNNENNKLHYYSIGSTKLPDQGNPQCICIEQNGRVWIGTNGGGVYLYNNKTDLFTQYLGDKDGGSLDGENIYTMCDAGEELIIGIHEGKLRKLNKRKNTLNDVDAPNVHYKIIRHVVNINDEIWVGTQEGIFIINELKKTVVQIQEDPMYSYAISDNQIEKIYADKENGIWIGTYFGGVNHLPNQSMDFIRHVPLSRSNSISSKRVRELREDSNGNILIGTDDGGLNIYDRKNKTFKQFTRNSTYPLSDNKTLALFMSDDEVWVGLFKKGLDIINLNNNQLKHYSAQQLGLNESSIYAICEDRNGMIWMGNAWSVFLGNKQEKKFIRQEQFGLNYIYDIIEDTQGYIWVATMGNGVYKYNPRTNTTEHYLTNQDDPNSISSNSISNITETSTGNIWFATDRGGICCYNKSTNDFSTFSTEDGFPDDTSYKILEDKEQNLWFGTNNGLVRFNPSTKDVRIFTRNDGLPGNQFNYKSALVSSDGKFYFGGLEGLVEFDPYQIRRNSFLPPTHITKLSINNKEIGIDSGNSPLKKSIIHTKKITLKHNQSNIGFNFVSLSYTAPSANKYAYKMENIDNDWIFTDNNHSASYAKLPPGKYVFRVKSSNNDGLWNEEGTSIEIEIKPPWWFSNLAYIVYTLLLISFLYFWINWYVKKAKKENKEKLRLFEIEKEKELYSSKLDFFTNIAHEIRTPITLINGPLETIIEMDIQDQAISRNLNIMQRNTSQLLTLINQLLDFRKVDSNKFLITFSKVNISQLIQELFVMFEASAAKQQREIKIHFPKSDVYAHADRSALTKILNNLLSNALKYSDKNIQLLLQTQEKDFIVTVINDGVLIPTSLTDKIFEPFYQANKNKQETSSSGIGLALARSLTELHNGSLHYEVQNDLNVFILKLPLEQEKVNEEIPQNDYVIEENENRLEKTNTEVILLVEDNIEMLNFIANKLQDNFIVEKAINGVEALKILEEKNIDLVLTDIMMDNMNGFELCQEIKQNLEYSHIPVVLLTAKTDLESKIHGLKMGADAYIEKPFSFGYLLTQLNTLLDNRRREKEAFIRKPILSIQQMGMNKADEEFMLKIVDYIEKNLTDTDFNVERLAELVFMSRSTLHRKIKGLTDTTPTDFIRIIRLRKATEYINEGKYRIGEICYLVGINSPSYFIKLFQRQFGITPKEFEKSLKQQST